MVQAHETSNSQSLEDGLINFDDTMADTEFAVPTVLDDKLTKHVMPPVGRFNEDPGNHQNLFRLASVICGEDRPAKRTSYDSKDSCPVIGCGKQLPETLS